MLAHGCFLVILKEQLFSIFTATEDGLQHSRLAHTTASLRLPESPGTSYLLAGVTAVFTLEPLLVLVSLLVLNEGVAFMEGRRAAATLHLRGLVRVQVAQVDT